MSKRLVEGQMNEMVTKGYKLVQMDARGNKMKRVSATGSKLEPLINELNIGRNDQCICGSGKKYKKCCGGIK